MKGLQSVNLAAPLMASAEYQLPPPDDHLQSGLGCTCG